MNSPLEIILLVLVGILVVLVAVLYRQSSKRRKEHQRFFSDNPNPMWVFDLSSQDIVDVNEAGIRVYGYSRQDFLSMSIPDLRPEDEQARLKEHITRVQHAELLAPEVWKHLKKNGEEFFVRVYAYPTQFNGKPARVVLALDVNEQALAEQQNRSLSRELARKNKYLESLLNTQATLAVIRLDMQGRFTYVNDAFFRRYGYRPEDLVGHHMITTLHHDDLIAVMEILKRCAGQPGKNFHTTLRMLHRETHRVFEIEFEFVAITDENGLVMEVQGMGQDSTEKAGYLRQLTEFNRQQESIMSSIRDVVWSCRVSDFAMQYISPASEQVFGYKPDDYKAIPNLSSIIVHPDDKGTVRKRFQDIIRDGEGDIEYRAIHPDGTVRYILDRIAVVPDEHGRPAVMNGVSSDITSLRLAEKKASDTSRQLSEVLESITDGFFAMDKDWNLIYMNREFEQANGLRREDYLGKNLWEEFPQLVGKTLWHEYHKAMLQQTTVHFEEYYDYVDRWYEITAYPNPEGIAIYFSDITQKKRSGEIILEQNKKLREIAWIQSHKVRAPVARILGLLHIFDRNHMADPGNMELLQMLENEALLLDNTIGEVVRKSNEVESLTEQEQG